MCRVAYGDTIGKSDENVINKYVLNSPIVVLASFLIQKEYNQHATSASHMHKHAEDPRSIMGT